MAVFGLSSPRKTGRNYPTPVFTIYNTCFIFSSMLYSTRECEVILTLIEQCMCRKSPRKGVFAFPVVNFGNAQSAFRKHYQNLLRGFYSFS